MRNESGKFLFAVVLAASASVRCGAVEFWVKTGTGTIQAQDILAQPKLGPKALIQNPVVHYNDRIAYKQACSKDGARRIVSASYDRARNLKVSAKLGQKVPPNPAPVQSYALEGYWTMLLSDVPKELCTSAGPGYSVAGPMIYTGSSGGSLTFSANNGLNEVAIWSPPLKP